MNNIILIDDDKAFISSFTNEAASHKINIAPANSLDGLKSFLPAFSHKFAGVVLDIKCLLTDNQAKEDANFIGAALNYIDTTVPGFPRFILTGDDTEFQGLKKYYPDEKMFLKTPDQLKLLYTELAICITDAEPLRLRRENLIVFDAFDKGLLDTGKESKLLNILKNYNNTDPNNFKGMVGDVREIHEEVYKALNRRNKSVVPNSFINNNGSPKFTGDFYRRLEGNRTPPQYLPTGTIYQDSTISAATKFIHSASSEFLHSTSSTNYIISHYTVKALINNLMEVIIWSKKY